MIIRYNNNFKPYKIENDKLYVNGICRHILLETIEEDSFRSLGYTRRYMCVHCKNTFDTLNYPTRNNFIGYTVIFNEKSTMNGTPILTVYPCLQCGYLSYKDFYDLLKIDKLLTIKYLIFGFSLD